MNQGNSRMLCSESASQRDQLPSLLPSCGRASSSASPAGTRLVMMNNLVHMAIQGALMHAPIHKTYLLRP